MCCAALLHSAVLSSFQRSVCSAPGPPSQATQLLRTQWYGPRATMFPYWPPWWSMMWTPLWEGAQVSDDTPSLRWRAAWRKPALLLNPQTLPTTTTPATSARPTQITPHLSLLVLHFQVQIHRSNGGFTLEWSLFQRLFEVFFVAEFSLLHWPLTLLNTK